MAATSIGPVRSPNFLSGTTDTTYQLHLTGEGNQALIEITDPASYANLNFKTPTQVWAMTAAGATAPSLPGTFHLFDLTAGVPLWWVEPGTGDTTMKGVVTAQTLIAIANIDDLPAGSIAIDYLDPVGYVWAKSKGPGLAAIQLYGEDSTGRTFTYMECAEGTPGNPVVAIFTPLQVSGVVTAPFFFATQLSDNTQSDNNAVVDYGSNTARLIGRGGGTSLADVQLTATTNEATNRSQVYCEGVEPSGAGSAVFIIHVPLELPVGIAGNVSMTGDLTVGNFTAENLAVSGDAIVDGNLQAQRADFTSCFVNGDAVLTRSDLPPGGIPYPPAGIGVSTGTAWGTSINATNPVFAGTVTANLKMKAMGYLPFDLTKTYVSIGTGNPASPPAVPDIILMNSAAPLDQKITLIGASTTSFFISATQDSGADHAWLWAHRSNFAITALDLIVNSNAGAQTITGAQSGLTIGWHLTGTVGETDFVNNRAGGGGGFNWYNAAPGDVLTSSSPALMKLDSSGKLTCNGDLVVGGATAAIGNAIDIGNRALGTFGGRPDVQSNGGELFINTVNGHGLYLNYDSGTGVNFGNGSGVVVGSVDSSGNATFGTINAFSNMSVRGGPGSASLGINNSVAYHDCHGVDTATLGSHIFRVINSNDSTFINALHLDTAGNATFGGAIQVGFGPALYLQTPAGFPNIHSDGASLFINATNGGGTHINADQGFGCYFHNPGGAATATIDSSGNATFNGTVTAAGKTFLVPHPLIEEKDLIHACLEGPENGVFYRGEVVTKDGVAEIELPDYFEALTFDEDRSVLLTQIVEAKSEKLALLAATRIINGSFVVVSSEDVRVAWEVKAVRRVGVDRLEVVRERKNGERQGDRAN